MNVRSPKTLVALAAGAVLTVLIAAPAQARDAQGLTANPAARPGASARTCDNARAFAYFQRQLRMTEGDNEPLLPADPAECGAMRVSDAQSGGAAATPARGDVEARNLSSGDNASALYLGGA